MEEVRKRISKHGLRAENFRDRARGEN